MERFSPQFVSSVARHRFPSDFPEPFLQIACEVEEAFGFLDAIRSIVHRAADGWSSDAKHPHDLVRHYAEEITKCLDNMFDAQESHMRELSELGNPVLRLIERFKQLLDETERYEEEGIRLAPFREMFDDKQRLIRRMDRAFLTIRTSATTTSAANESKSDAITFRGETSYEYRGRHVCMSPSAHAVLQEFLKNGRAMQTSELENRVSNVAEAIEYIEQHIAKEAVHRPRLRNDGYFIAVRPAV